MLSIVSILNQYKTCLKADTAISMSFVMATLCSSGTGTAGQQLVPKHHRQACGGYCQLLHNLLPFFLLTLISLSHCWQLVSKSVLDRLGAVRCC